MIELKNIKKVYGKGDSKTLALKGINLKIEKGEFVTITGKSGCGKSTLLNILGCMDSPSEGEYFFDDKNVNQMSDKELSLFKNKKIGYIFQSFHLINELSLLENVALPLGYAGFKKKERNKIAMDMLTLVGLEAEIKKIPMNISGGQRQRAAIARALANKPEVILADEPTGNLDEKNSQEIMDLLRKVNEENTTVIMVTHDMQIASHSKRVVKMQDGLIIEDKPGSLYL